MTYSPIELSPEVTLRPVSIDDAPALLASVQRNLERLRPWFYWANETLDLRAAERALANIVDELPPRADYEYTIRHGGEFAGSIGLYKIDYANRIARIGYWLDAAFEGRGYVTLAARALVDFAFAGLQLNRIEIRCAPENAPSRAVPTRLGFTQEGVHRQVLALHGGFQDLVMYAMLADEWRRR